MTSTSGGDANDEGAGANPTPNVRDAATTPDEKGGEPVQPIDLDAVRERSS
jgi:hypothetical protein